MPWVSQLTIIDRGVYEESNWRGQDIAIRDLGRPKAAVQAQRLRDINPSIAVNPIHGDLEDLPLGQLKGDVILACLDSRRARLVVNQSAWRLGVPWINAGIDATGLLARVQVFVPAPNTCCLECAFDSRDYELVEQTYPCQAQGLEIATAAPSALGALAAALQAVECQKLLSGDHEGLLSGRDVLLDARHHRHYVTTFGRNPECRMPDHETWRITTLNVGPSHMTLQELTALGRTLEGANGGLRIAVAGQQIANALTCPACRDRREAWILQRAVRHSPPRCPRCDCMLAVNGFDLYDSVAADDIPRRELDSPLADHGLLARDVLTLATPAGETHFELGGTQ
jgi:molybdopterin/thiamine biosynthesis adenylyltransferase